MARVLIIKLGALGDAIMATPIVNRILAHHTGDDVTILTSPPFAPIYHGWPGLETKIFPRKGLKAGLATVRWIRRRRFHRIYDLQSNDRSRIYCALSGAPERIGNHPAWPYTIHPPDHYTGDYHIFERMNRILQAAGIDPAVPQVYLPLTPGESRSVQTWMKEHGIVEKGFVIMHAGASGKHPEKCWPFYDRLALALRDKGIQTVWIGGPEEGDRNRQLAGITGTDASSCFSINQLAGLARHACFALTNDSGPMHALSGSGIRVYAFFGVTNHVRNHALGQEDNVITHQPKTVQGKRLTDPEYRLSNISCDEVLSRLRGDGLID